MSASWADALVDYRKHMKTVHRDNDPTRQVLETHRERYLSCQSAPSLKDYALFGDRAHRPEDYAELLAGSSQP